MIDFDQLKRDREAGTSGIWEYIAPDGRFIIAPDKTKICQMLHLNGRYGLGGRKPDRQVASDSRRIARVPDLEALALAARELAEACRNIQQGRNSGNIGRMNVALAAWDKAEKGETND